MAGNSGEDRATVLTAEEDKPVTLPSRLPAEVKSRKLRSSEKLYRSFIHDTLSRVRLEVEEGTSLRFAIDFDMLAEVIEPDRGVYKGVMCANLAYARENPEHRFVLLEGTRREIAKYVRNRLVALGRQARHAHRKTRILSEQGVFDDPKWQPIKDDLEQAISETDRAFAVLTNILLDCCQSIRSLQVCDEDITPEPAKKKTYMRALEAGDNERRRSRDANDADADNLAVLSALSAKDTKDTDFRMSLVSGTVPVHKTAEKTNCCDIATPVECYLYHTAHRELEDHAAVINFLNDCSVEMAQLSRVADLFRYGESLSKPISRREIKRNYIELERIGTRGALGLLQSWVHTANSQIIYRWMTGPPDEGRLLQVQKPSIGIGRTVTLGRRLLSMVLDADRGAEPTEKELVEVLGGTWRKPEDLPNGSREVLAFSTPPCTISLERFGGFYSIYWEADADISGFLCEIRDLQQQGILNPAEVAGVASDGEIWQSAISSEMTLDSIREANTRQTMSMLIVRSPETDLYYQGPQFGIPDALDFTMDPRDSARDSRVAVVSRSEDLRIPATLCERTCAVYLTTEDFTRLFADRIRKSFESSLR